MSVLDRFQPRDYGFNKILSSLLHKPAAKPDPQEMKSISYDDLALSLIHQLDNIADTIGANVTVRFYAECPICEKEHGIDYELNKFDPSNHYCGGSPRCCP